MTALVSRAAGQTGPAQAGPGVPSGVVWPVAGLLGSGGGGSPVKEELRVAGHPLSPKAFRCGENCPSACPSTGADGLDSVVLGRLEKVSDRDSLQRAAHTARREAAGKCSSDRVATWVSRAPPACGGTPWFARVALYSNRFT